MAGVLTFALGLETSAFASGLDRAAGRMVAFLSVGKLLSETVEGVWGAIERGGALQDLSARTGETVGNLYQMQEAFKVVGISAESLPGMINRLNKSLSGVDEMGKKTEGAFAALGLSVEDLKGLDAPGQFEAVSGALAGLDKAAGMDVASRLFGREGAANMMQISRDAEGFKQTIADSAREAAVFARNAAAFDKLGDTITRVKGSLSGMFAGIAEGVVPTLQGVVEALQKIDLVAIGQDIGTMFSGAFQAFREGKLAELIGDTIVFGLSAAAVMAPGIFQKIGVALLKALETPLIYLQAGMEFVVQKFMEFIGKIPKIGKAAGFDGFKAQSMADILTERKGKGAEFFTEGMNLTEMNKSANDSLKMGTDSLKEQYSMLFSKLGGFAARAPKSEVASTALSKSTVPDFVSTNYQKPDVTSLEKMGFIFNGGGANDPAKGTERNTKSLVEQSKLTNKFLEKMSSTPLALQNI